MSKYVKRKLQNQAGAAIVEYTPILALFLLIALPSVHLTGVNLSKRFCEVEAGVGGSIHIRGAWLKADVGTASAASFLPCGSQPSAPLTGATQSGYA